MCQHRQVVHSQLSTTCTRMYCPKLLFQNQYSLYQDCIGFWNISLGLYILVQVVENWLCYIPQFDIFSNAPVDWGGGKCPVDYIIWAKAQCDHCELLVQSPAWYAWSDPPTTAVNGSGDETSYALMASTKPILSIMSTMCLQLALGMGGGGAGRVNQW